MDYNIPKSSNYYDIKDYKADQVQEFLKKIAALESSSGQNTNHHVMQTGIHAGTSAVGDYGLMPLTAQEIEKQSGGEQLQDVDKFDAQKKLEQDPELTRRLAETMASKLLNKNDSEQAAYKWLMGQYSNPSKEELNESPRVRKFRTLSSVK